MRGSLIHRFTRDGPLGETRGKSLKEKRCNPLHYHPNYLEVLLVLEGNGRHLVDEEWVDVEAGTTIRIPAAVRHKLVNTGAGPLRCVIAFSSGERETVFLE